MINSDYIISYEFGYQDWYVSEFYKYFHKKLEDYLKIKLDYFSIRDLAKKYGYDMDNSDGLFNWFNLIIVNKKNNKMFVHSWYDYAHVTMDWCVKNNFNISKFSCVSNLTEEYIQKYSFAQPSVYYFENWSDHSTIKEIKKNKKINKIYFAGLDYGLRGLFIDKFKNYDRFTLTAKNKDYKNKKLYLEELSVHKFGLSFNGVANICYRDLELLALGTLNLREPLTSKTFNPLIPNVHYLEFIDQDFIKTIISGERIEEKIKEKLEFLDNFCNSSSYLEMIENGFDWYEKNCLPENQFKIISSFLEELNILDN